MYDQRILVIHAGGLSQRLVSHSVTGKLFAALPVKLSDAHVGFQMIDYKLCVFLKFLPLIKGGAIFITCSDDIITFNFTEKGNSLNIQSKASISINPA